MRRSLTAPREPSSTERWWAVLRLTLGVLQMTCAAVALGLLVAGGVTTSALIAVVITGLMTTISVMLFGSRRRGPAEPPPRARSS